MKNYTILLLTCTLLLSSCKTYTVSPEKFKEQIIASHQERKEATVNNPLKPYVNSSNIKYTMNNIKYLNVYSKDGALFFMQNSPSVEMRVTLKNGKKKYFYLDTVFLENDTLKGSKSRLLAIENVVPFNEIVKIEVQDGGKKYQYQ